MSETAKHRDKVAKYCGGVGLDLGAGGDPVNPWAISIDTDPESLPHMVTDARRLLMFRTGALDFVYSSHLLEDYKEWVPILQEWGRVVRPGGYLVILVPDKERFRAAIEAGQPPNMDHKHESEVGELTKYFTHSIGGWEVVEDRFASDEDYTILFVARKIVK